MSSIIEGFNYDIFISYRQKDNKHDGWVTEFVDNLKGELESTFKEEISVYFDINPHDGLLETHEVSDSLNEKLKCLIFIPIISRTYCDQKSFAWEHEFKAFIELASSDQYGLKIKLPNGNVASRVLPVRIHDLDQEDIELCESLLESALRGVEFIYKAAGVNRPLRSMEEKPHDNINNTIYRDQINKVANAIDEIIRSVRKIQTAKKKENLSVQEAITLSEKQEKRKADKQSVRKPAKDQTPRIKRIFGLKSRVVRIVFIPLVLVIIILWYLWPFLVRPKIMLKNFESSVAVLLFDDISEKQGYENFATGATNDLISRLARIRDLKVVPITESLKYKQLNNPNKAICKDNDVKMVLQGSVKAENENITVKAELIDGVKDIVLWKQSKSDRLENILSIQDEIVGEVARAININYSSYQVKKQMAIRPTKNFKAYELFLKGNAELTKWTDESLKESLIYYGRALEIDKNFIEAWANSALANLLIAYFYEQDNNMIENIKKDAKKTLSFESDNEIALMSMEGYYLMKISSGQKLGLFGYREMICKLKNLISKNPSSPMAFFGLAEYYRLLKKNRSKAAEYLKLSLTQCERILQNNPSNGIILGIAAQSAGILGQIEFKTGNFLEAIKKTEYSIELVPGIARTYTQLSNFYYATDQPQKARAIMDKAIANVRNASDRAYIALLQGHNSMIEGKYKDAEQYWGYVMNTLGDPRDAYYDYALLYRSVVLRKLGDSSVADSLIRNRLKSHGINSWPEPIINFFAGSLREEEIIALAKRDWQKCEAFFFAGENDLILGNLNEAKRHFEDCINTKATDYLEYEMSQAELSHSFQGIR